MVAQRSSNSRCKALVYLALLALIACTETQYTMVELEHKSPDELLPIIEHQLKGDIEYHTAGQTIVFYAHKKDIQSTIALLAKIDQPINQLNIYTLEFSWKNPARYSTTKLPTPIPVTENKKHTVTLFDKPWVIYIQPANDQQVLLTIKNKKKRKSKNQQQYFLTLNQENEINHILLPKELILTIKQH